MKTARRITSNFLSLSISQVVVRLLQLVVFVFIARIFGSEKFGNFSFGLFFALLTFVFIDFGLSRLSVREISRNRKLVNKYVSNSLVIKFFLSIFTLIGTYAFLEIFNYPLETKVITYIMVIAVIIQSYNEILYSIFRAFERMHFESLIRILKMTVLLSLVFLFSLKGYNLVTITLAFPLSEFIIFLVSIIITFKKFVRIRPEFEYDFCIRLIKKSSLFCLSVIFSGLLLYIDVVMLSKLKTANDVGIYSAASYLVIALLLIPVMYSNAIFPVISRFYATSKKMLRFAYEKSFYYMLLLGLPASIGIFIFADQVIFLVFGSGYKLSAIALKVLAAFIALRSVNIISGTFLSSINRQGSVVLSQGVAAFSNIVLNFILIPLFIFGFIGAGIATIITDIILFILYTYFIRKYKLKIMFVRILFKPLIASIIMLLFILYIENLFIGIIIGVAVYSLALLILRAFDKEDIRLLRKIITNQ